MSDENPRSGKTETTDNEYNENAGEPENGTEEAKEKDLSFMREQIKRQPFYQRKSFRRLIRQVLAAVLCGAVACFVFVKLYPWMDDTFGREEPSEITIPDDEDELPEDTEPEPVPEDTDEEEQDDVEETEDVTETDDAEEEYEPLEFTAEEYGNLYDALDDVVDGAASSLVNVTLSDASTDWFSTVYGETAEISGILVGNNGVELLILVPYLDELGTDELSAEFVDGTAHEAVLKTYDVISNLAVLSVNLSDISQETLAVIQTAELGSSRYLKAGEPVIAVGSPAGITDSVKYGILVADSYAINVVDGEFALLITDMAASDGASGVLLNLDGQVVGLIEDTYTASGNENVLTAYGISQMKGIIENLSNSQDVAYMGITGAQVTADIAESEGIPTGVYVSGVEQDSPALTAGIQAGDIITEINGNTVSTMSDIKEMLLLYSNEQVIQVNVMRQGKDEYKEIGCKVTLSVLK